MPLWWDVVHYDVLARAVLRGAALYRDADDNNLPGMPWMQAAVRAVVGWRPEMLRLADLTILAAVVGLMLRWVPGNASGRTRVWTLVVLAGYYLSTPEICHCQRDGWLLLPAVIALTLRDRQRRRVAEQGGPAFGLAVLEGLCWGAAFWIKPFIAIPAIVCWLSFGLCFARGQDRIPLHLLMCDLGGLLIGGLLAGGLGLVWLAWSGGWADFWDTILIWDQEYADYARRFVRWRQLLYWTIYTLPWSAIHVPALVIAATTLSRAVRRGSMERDGSSPSVPLLAAFYLGLMVDAIFAQLPHDYVMTSTMFPAVVLFAAEFRTRESRLFSGLAFLTFALLAALVTPALHPSRFVLWARCCREWSTPELRQRLALNNQWGAGNWQDLGHVADFFRPLNLHDGELTCMSGATNWLYIELNVEPSTRFDVPAVATFFFPAHAETVRRELDASRSKYVVSDLMDPSLPYVSTRFNPLDDSHGLPPDFPADRRETYPWNQTLVFRSGRYVVHRVQGPVTRFWWPNYVEPEDTEQNTKP
jgi:hypothetical protein